MGKYKKCPRCELNWIAMDEELCEVCKAELGKASSISLLEDDEDELDMENRICPICKVNYLEDDEELCPSCRQEQAMKNREKADDDGWRDFVDDEEEPLPLDEEQAMSLNQMQDEEYEEEEEEENPDPDDFDESLEDIGEYDDDDEEEDDDEEDF